MVNVFLPQAPMPPGTPRAALGPVTGILSALIRTAVRRGPAADPSVGLLPAAAARPDLAWADGDPVLADAFARAGAAIESAARDAVPDAVRAVVLERLAGWDGRPAELSRAWLEPLVARLPAPDRAAGRLALLVAFAAYQVDADLVERVRAGADGGRPADDATLIALASWAAFAAAARAGSWLRIDPGDQAAGSGPAGATAGSAAPTAPIIPARD
jgi:hypothetical protein